MWGGGGAGEKGVSKGIKHSALNHLKFTICGIQLKITRHAKKQENIAYDEEEN